MNVIGANFDNAVANLNTPGYWNGDVKLTMYVPDATEQMSDAELQTNYNELQIRIDAWTKLRYAPVYWSGTSKSNMDFIISTYQSKQLEYSYLIEQRTPPQNTTTVVTPGGEVIEVENKPNWGLYLVGGAALIYFILKKNKKIK